MVSQIAPSTLPFEVFKVSLTLSLGEKSIESDATVASTTLVLVPNHTEKTKLS